MSADMCKYVEKRADMSSGLGGFDIQRLGPKVDVKNQPNTLGLGTQCPSKSQPNLEAVVIFPLASALSKRDLPNLDLLKTKHRKPALTTEGSGAELWNGKALTAISEWMVTL